MISREGVEEKIDDYPPRRADKKLKGEVLPSCIDLGTYCTYMWLAGVTNWSHSGVCIHEASLSCPRLP